MKRFMPAAIVLGLIIVLFFGGWLARKGQTDKVHALARENPPPRVVTSQLKPNTAPEILILPSSAQAWHFTPVWARVNGYLLRYLVDIGDPVKQGDLLAEIDTPETDQELAQAKANLVNALAEKDIAQITNDRWQKLWGKNREAVSKQEVDQYSANLQSTEALVIANEKNVERLTYQQQFKFIYAPFDGVITQRLIDLGSLIYGSVNGTPQQLFQIAQTDTIRFFVEVPQTFFRQINVGLETEVSILQYPGKTFKGTVTRYAKALDPTARTLLTQVDVANTERLMYPGLYATVKFIMDPVESTFTIPTTAVIIRDTVPQVAIVDENQTVHLRDVRIGRDFGNEMEIIHGLAENEQIIVLPTDRIVEGVKVEVLPPASNSG